MTILRWLTRKNPKSEKRFLTKNCPKNQKSEKKFLTKNSPKNQNKNCPKNLLTRNSLKNQTVLHTNDIQSIRRTWFIEQTDFEEF